MRNKPAYLLQKNMESAVIYNGGVGPPAQWHASELLFHRVDTKKPKKEKTWERYLTHLKGSRTRKR